MNWLCVWLKGDKIKDFIQLADLEKLLVRNFFSSFVCFLFKSQSYFVLLVTWNIACVLSSLRGLRVSEDKSDPGKSRCEYASTWEKFNTLLMRSRHYSVTSVWLKDIFSSSVYQQQQPATDADLRRDADNKLSMMRWWFLLKQLERCSTLNRDTASYAHACH